MQFMCTFCIYVELGGSLKGNHDDLAIGWESNGLSRESYEV
jgi:hypothetical protein